MSPRNYVHLDTRSTEKARKGQSTHMCSTWYSVSVSVTNRNHRKGDARATLAGPARKAVITYLGVGCSLIVKGGEEVAFIEQAS